MEFEYKEFYQYPTSICLNVTDACNLACRYCFVEQHPHYMSLDIAKKAIEWVINNRKKRNEIFGINIKNSCLVTFFGGEPTLMWDDIIVPLVLWTEKEYPNQVQFTITTNGTLLNKERILFLFNHNINPLLSIDGNKITQDYNRPCHNNQSSFDLVSKNFNTLLTYFPKTTFRSTIIPNTVDQVFNNFIFAIEHGFQSYFMMPNERELWSKEKIEQLDLEIKKIFTFYACCFKKNVVPNIYCSVINDAFNDIIQIKKNELLDVDLRLINKNVERCGLGTNSASVGYDGSIYGCQEQTSKENNIFYLGNIFTGINIEKHKQLLSNYSFTQNEHCINLEECLNCPLQKKCIATACPSSQFDSFKTFSLVSDIACKWHQILFKYANNFLNNTTVKNEAFLYYLNHQTDLKKYLKGDDY